MSTTAQCGAAYKNLGSPLCSPSMLAARRLIIMKRFDDDGLENKLNLSVTWDKAYFDSFLSNADRSKRIFPTANADNVQDVQADTVYETTPGGDRFFVKDGGKPVTMEFWKADPSYKGKLNSVDYGAAFIVDLAGNLIGDKSEDGFLKPIPMSPSSFRARFMKATDTTVQKVMLDYDWLQTFCDEDLGIVGSSAFASDISMLDYAGLIEVVSTPGAPVVGATTTIPFSLKVCLSKLKETVPAEGLALANFTVTNLTTGLPVVPTVLTESTPGDYVLDIPNQTSSDVLSIDVSGSVYDLSSPFTVTIP